MGVRLELHWRGLSLSPSFGATILHYEALNIHMKKGSHLLAAPIERHNNPEESHRLQLVTQRKTNADTRTVSVISSATPNLFKTMQVTARVSIILNTITPVFNGFYKSQKYLRTFDKPVFIYDIPEFETGKTYQLEVQNCYNMLRGVFKEKIASKSLSKNEPIQDTPFLKPTTITNELYHLTERIIGSAILDTSLESDDPELGKLSMTELQDALKVLNLNLQSARRAFADACIKEDPDVLDDTIKMKQEIRTHIAAIERELKKRETPSQE